ncbi:hypothetical protein [Jannaschia sp. R86511]|uniref:hypothetical protein n=1 Tax=Jannaschia sp. R86511 TaxID=3093853 RepID=UPI0036D2E7B7
MTYPVVLAIALTVAAAAVLAWSWLPVGGRALLQGAARRADLAPPADDRATVVRRLQERRSAAAGGLVAGAWLAALLVPADPDPVDRFVTPAAVPLVIGGAFVGLAVAAGLHAVLSARRTPAQDAPRLARSREVGVGDYVDGIERWGTVVVCLAPPAVALALAVLPTGLLDAGVDPLRLGLLALVPPALLVLSTAASTAVLAAPQTVTSPVELAWDDALRSQALRDIVSTPMYAGLLALLWLGLDVASAIPDERLATGATGLWVMLALGAMVVLLVVVLATRPASHFRRRLWPVEQVPAASGARP